MSKNRVILIAALIGGLGLAVMVSGCSSPSIPEIGRDLPANYKAADDAFKQRVRDRFPLGTAERDVVDTLVHQGFTLSGDGKLAYFEQPPGPGTICLDSWRVFWSVDADHKVKTIDGLFGGSCL